MKKKLKLSTLLVAGGAAALGYMYIKKKGPFAPKPVQVSGW